MLLLMQRNWVDFVMLEGRILDPFLCVEGAQLLHCLLCHLVEVFIGDWLAMSRPC